MASGIFVFVCTSQLKCVCMCMSRSVFISSEAQFSQEMPEFRREGADNKWEKERET